MVLLDVIQHLVVLFVLEILMRLGVYVLAEDSLPTMLLDHSLYLQIYGDPQSGGGFFERAYGAAVRVILRYARRDMNCIYLQAAAQVRPARAAGRRGRARVDIATKHDRARGETLRHLSSSIWGDVLVVDTDQATPERTCKEIIARLGL